MNNEYSINIITALRACADLCEHIIIDADAHQVHREEAAKVLRLIESVLLLPKE